MFLWRRYDLKLYGTRAVESMLAILCHILRYREQSKLPVKGKDNQTQQQQSTPQRPAIGSGVGATSQSTNDLTAQSNNTGPSTSQLVNSAVSRAPRPPPPSAASWIASLAAATSSAATSSAATTPTSLEPGGQTPLVDSSAVGEVLTQEIPGRMQRTSSADQAVANSRTSGQSTTSTTSASAGGSVSAGGTPLSNHMAAAYELGINVDHLRQLMDMGFSVEMCIEALITSNSLVQATDYLLNANTSGGAGAAHQQHHAATGTTASAAAAVSAVVASAAASVAANALANATTASTVASQTTPTIAGDQQTDQEMLRLFNNLKSEEVAELLKPEELDLFTETIMDQCLKILDTVPETVYKVCEVLVAVGQRNGSAWMKETLTGIVTQIEAGIESIYYAIEKDVDVLLTPEFKTDSAPVAHRIHLFSLMFEVSYKHLI